MGMETLVSSKDSKIQNVEIIVSFAFPSKLYSPGSHPGVSKTNTLPIFKGISKSLKLSSILLLLLL